MRPPPGRLPLVASALFLTALAAAAFAGTVRNGFVALDDKSFVYDNPQVPRGLGWETALWALRSTENANWYPVTRLTHLADASLFGLWAGGHHLVSLAWHAAAAVLLFLALRQMTGRLWRSLVVAAVFAVHPLQAESVAWVAERSNVLAGFFFGLTLLLWARCVRKPGRGRYLAVVFSCALGLMSKPVLVTLPLVLLLLDCWPLGRLLRPGGRVRIDPARVMLEKAPLLLLAALASATTLVTQDQAGAVRTFDVVPLGSRLGNAVLSWAVYARKTVLPEGLAVYYPHPGTGIATGSVLPSALALAVVTTLALSQLRRRPWLLVGWLWFGGTLVPMIGIVQVGSQAMADRYAYLALPGMGVALVWLFAEGLRVSRALTALGGVAVAVALAALGTMAASQAALWRDTRTLLTHSLAATGPSSFVLTSLGQALADEGSVAEALPLLEQAVRFSPRDPKARNGLGYALSLDGRPLEAEKQFRAAIELAPGFVEARSNLGIALAWSGRHAEARGQLLDALRLDPGYAEALNNLGKVYALLGLRDESIASFRRAIERKPAMVAARFNLGEALLKADRPEEAAAAFEEVLRHDPGHARARAILRTIRAAGGAR